MALTTLAQHMDMEWLREAYRCTRKDAAPGVDEQSAEEYAMCLEGNLQSLLDRAKSGTYWAPPLRRVHIPKPGSPTETRPIGLPTFEDKVLQRAVTMLVEAVYEQDFLLVWLPSGPLGALEVLRQHLITIRGGWVLDIRKCFDTLDRGHMRAILRQRIRDGVLLRLIGKWLNAGIVDAGVLFYSAAGSPQGAVISPLLCNVYLHEVLDTWFDRTVRPRLHGRGYLVRYADDAVLVFEREDDARRVMAVIAQRFERFGLMLHPQKTRLGDFQRPRNDGGGPCPSSFDLLGFTHYWRRSLKGHWVVEHRTAKDRLRRAVSRRSLRGAGRTVAGRCENSRRRSTRSYADIILYVLRNGR